LLCCKFKKEISSRTNSGTRGKVQFSILVEFIFEN
jgi:hypothetical protein